MSADATQLAAQATLAKHGRTFRQAQILLPADRAEDAAVIYALCRLADDIADESADADEARAGLDRLAAELRQEVAPSDVVERFLAVMARRGGSVEPALALIAALRGDLDPVRVADDAELLRYAWGVAGTVGLMMSPVLGAKAAEARGPAEDLGVAMQITNICRDVREDAQRGRVYLPATRLRAAGLSPEEILSLQADRAALSQVVRELLDLAEVYYLRARAGYRYLPWRPRLAVVVAGALYRRIGLRLRRVHDADPMVGRTVVPPLERLWVAIGALLGQLRPGLRA